MLGVPVSVVGKLVDAEEFANWRRLGPWGEARDDWRFAAMTANLVTEMRALAYGRKFKRSHVADPNDYLIRFESKATGKSKAELIRERIAASPMPEHVLRQWAGDESDEQ